MLASPNSPLGRKVSEYLCETHPNGLMVPEIYNRLVEDLKYSGTSQLIVDLLANHPNVYVRGPNGRWLDAASVATDGGCH